MNYYQLYIPTIIINVYNNNIIIIYSLLGTKKINKQKYRRKIRYELIPKSIWYKN